MRKFIRKALRLAAWTAAFGVLAVIVVAALFKVLCYPTVLFFNPTPETHRNPPQAAGIPNYARPEVDTFYTYPEWYIVWSYQSKADFQATGLPSGYSYFGDIAQFWRAYGAVYAATRAVYPSPTGDHIMLAVIGSSFTVEYALKGLYEETLGRLSEWTSHHQLVEEDRYAAKVAQDYATFVHIRPFYEFSFAHALRGLWVDTPLRTTHLTRTLERRIWLTLDYAVESIYCEIIELGTHATYGFEDTTTKAWVDLTPEARSTIASTDSHVKIIRDLGNNQAVIEIPRYQEFTASAQSLIQSGVHFHQIAANELIVISAIASTQWTNDARTRQLLLTQPLLTNPGKTRVVLLCRVPDLHTIVPQLKAEGLEIEHLYDY